MKKLANTRNRSRLLALFGAALALIFIFSALPAGVFAADPPAPGEESQPQALPEPAPDKPGEAPALPPGQLKKVTATADPDTAVEMKSHSQKIDLRIPKGALKQSAEIEIVERQVPL